jgi:hypothetical protein
MAYTATFTKSGVSKQSDIISNISVTVFISDGAETIFEKAYSQLYNSNVTTLADFKVGIMKQVQIDWDKYITEQNIYNAVAFDMALTDMQTITNSYINSQGDA